MTASAHIDIASMPEKFHDAADGASLLTAMQSILSDLVPCDYELSAKVSDPDFVRVSVDGEARPLDDSDDGWSLAADKQTIVLGKNVCAELQSAGDHSIDVTVECEKVVVVTK